MGRILLAVVTACVGIVGFVVLGSASALRPVPRDVPVAGRGVPAAPPVTPSPPRRETPPTAAR